MTAVQLSPDQKLPLPHRGSLVRKVRTLVALPLAVKLVLPAVFVVLLSASAAVTLLPYRQLSWIFGRHIGAVALVPLVSVKQQRKAVLLSRALAIAATYLPARSDCYPQALAAALLCRLLRLPYALHFGAVSRDSEAVGAGRIAHAWVASGKVALSGGTSFERCQVMSCYVSPGLHL